MSSIATGASKIVMTDEQFKALRDIIYERSGINFEPQKKYVLES
ncbi:MAG: protein-glutamate O-methyltransferase CheR, partial [Planctomycetota bacterium]